MLINNYDLGTLWGHKVTLLEATGVVAGLVVTGCLAYKGIQGLRQLFVPVAIEGLPFTQEEIERFQQEHERYLREFLLPPVAEVFTASDLQPKRREENVAMVLSRRRHTKRKRNGRSLNPKYSHQPSGTVSLWLRSDASVKTFNTFIEQLRSQGMSHTSWRHGQQTYYIDLSMLTSTESVSYGSMVLSNGRRPPTVLSETFTTSQIGKMSSPSVNLPPSQTPTNAGYKPYASILRIDYTPPPPRALPSPPPPQTSPLPVVRTTATPTTVHTTTPSTSSSSSSRKRHLAKAKTSSSSSPSSSSSISSDSSSSKAHTTPVLPPLTIKEIIDETTKVAKKYQKEIKRRETAQIKLEKARDDGMKAEMAVRKLDKKGWWTKNESLEALKAIETFADSERVAVEEVDDEERALETSRLTEALEKMAKRFFYVLS